jgi:hypothetical protein
MADMTYGTPEYYAEQFADFLADVDQANPKYGDAIVEGFFKAIDDWAGYHSQQVDEYNRLRERVRKALTV